MNPLRIWNTFWFGPISARPLGVYRIVFGTIALANLGFLAFDLDYWFTNIGILQGTEAQELAGPLRPSILHWIQDPLGVRLFFGAAALAMVLLIVGWHTRIMAVLFYFAMVTIHQRNVLTNSGADTLVLIMAFYLMLSPSGAAFSLDARRKAKKSGIVAEPLILPWAQRLIQLHISLIYLNTAVLKSGGASWINGTAIHYVILNSEVGRPLLAWLSEYPIVINLMTHGALMTELAIPFLLWFRATRIWAILAGIGLHSAIHLTVNIPIFGEVMIAGYIAFLTPEELSAALRFFDPRNWIGGRKPDQARTPVAVPGRVDPGSSLLGPHRVEPSPVSRTTDDESDD
jgi:hypothetical protein